jgi:WD40 repeat protein
LAYRVVSAIIFTRSVFGSNIVAADKFDQQIIHGSAYDFFERRVKKIQFESKGRGMCRGNVNAYVSYSDDGIMHICPCLANQDDLIISTALIHEARHFDGYNHTTCNHGFYNGQAKSCDESYSEGGAYAAGVEYLVKVARAYNIDRSIRQNARALAIESLLDKFNELPLGIEKGAILVADDLSVLFYNGETSTPLRPLARATDHLYLVGGHLEVYDPIEKTSTKLTDGVTLGPVENIEYGGEETGEFVDWYMDSGTQCSLYTHKVICFFQGRRVDLPISGFTPVGFWSYAPIVSDDNVIHIISKERRIYNFTADSQAFQSKTAPVASVADWNKSYFLALGFDGSVFFLKKEHGIPDYVTPGLDTSHTFTKIIAPYYWSKQLQEL